MTLATDMPKVMRAAATAFASIPLDEPLGQCYGLARQNVRDNFTAGATPSGVSWPPRKKEEDKPLPWLDEQRHPLLILSGKMMQAATGGGGGHVKRIGGRQLAMGVNLDAVPYARAQDKGYPPNNLPERHYLGVSEKTQRQQAELIGDYIESEVF